VNNAPSFRSIFHSSISSPSKMIRAISTDSMQLMNQQPFLPQ
jgi:hypothetical protein